MKGSTHSLSFKDGEKRGWNGNGNVFNRPNHETHYYLLHITRAFIYTNNEFY